MAGRKRITVDTLLGITAVVTSLCALGITFYQAYLQRTQQYASVMPVIQCYNTNKVDGTWGGYAFVIDNKGLGPAFIEDAAYFYDDHQYNSVDEVIRVLKNDAALKQDTAGRKHIITSDISKGWIIPQGQSVNLVEVNERGPKDWLREKLDHGNLTIKVLYRSVYGEEWLMTYPPVDRSKAIVKQD